MPESSLSRAPASSHAHDGRLGLVCPHRLAGEFENRRQSGVTLRVQRNLLGRGDNYAPRCRTQAAQFSCSRPINHRSPSPPSSCHWIVAFFVKKFMPQISNLRCFAWMHEEGQGRPFLKGNGQCPCDFYRDCHFTTRFFLEVSLHCTTSHFTTL